MELEKNKELEKIYPSKNRDLENTSDTLSLPAATVADMSDTKMEPLAATFSNFAAIRSAVKLAEAASRSVIPAFNLPSMARIT